MEVRFLNLEYFFNWIVELFRSLINPDAGTGLFAVKVIAFFHFLFKVLIPILIVVLFIAWIYYQIRIVELRRYERDHTYKRLLKKQQEVHTTRRNARWEQIETLFNSNSPGDWRLAIIEADNMLEDLITQLGYEGDNLGERLKDARNRKDFANIEPAWEVHLVRNKIAHEGLAYHLIEREKKNVNNLYRQIFSDAGYI